MRILFTGVGKCKIYEIVEMSYIPPEGATINFYKIEGDDKDEEWTVRTVVHLPNCVDTVGDMGIYEAYVVVGG